MFRPIGLVTLIAVATACGRNNTQPASPGITVTSLGSHTKGNGSGPSFHGTIADLRQSGLAAGAQVAIDQVVVTSISGSGSDFYISDPAGGPYSGIDVSPCSKCSATPPSKIGTFYSVTGTLAVSGLHLSLTSVAFAALPGTSPGMPVPYPVSALLVSQGNLDNAGLRGVYVTVTDAPAVVVNVTPGGDLLNTSYTLAMQDACMGTSGVTQSKSQCCPKGGPKYYGFWVNIGGQTVEVSTDDFPSKANSEGGIDIEVWPCDGNFSEQGMVSVGENLGYLNGVFDVPFGAGNLLLTSKNDYSVPGSPASPAAQPVSVVVSAAAPVAMCQSCASDSDCGTGLCIRAADRNSYCGTQCAQKSDCQSGAGCYEIDDSSGDLLGYDCFPSSNLCQ